MYLQPINNVLIIGSQGFLGNRLIQHLNLHDKLQIFTDRTLVPGFDLHNSNHRERVLRLCNPQVVIQTAWCTRMNYLESPENARYAESTIDFLDECSNFSVQHFVGFGTGLETYIRVPQGQSRVSNLINSEYVKSKINTRNKIFEIAQDLGVRVDWVQIFQLYGMGQHREKFFPYSIRTLMNHKPIQVEYPFILNDWVWIDDVCNLVISLVQNRNDSAIHQAGSGSSISNQELINQLARAIQSRSKIHFNEKNVEIFDYRAEVPHPLMNTSLSDGITLMIGADAKA